MFYNFLQFVSPPPLIFWRNEIGECDWILFIVCMLAKPCKGFVLKISLSGTTVKSLENLRCWLNLPARLSGIVWQPVCLNTSMCWTWLITRASSLCNLSTLMFFSHNLNLTPWYFISFSPGQRRDGFFRCRGSWRCKLFEEDFCLVDWGRSDQVELWRRS